MESKTATIKYVTPEEARKKSGTRVALTVGSFGPWGQAVKKMLEVKGIPYAPVAQFAGEANDELVKWTGMRNAPTIVSDDQPPIARWLDQIMFIENYKPAPPLLPQDSASRIEALGIVFEIAGEDGLGWTRRLLMFDSVRAAQPTPPPDSKMDFGVMMKQYGFEQDAIDVASRRVIEILGMLAKRLKQQREKGSAFFVGSNLTVADIYWASFSYIFLPLDEDLCSTTQEIRQLHTETRPDVLAAIDPILLEHRDAMFRKHLGPCVFMPAD